MFQTPNYSVIQKIQEGLGTVIYRAVRPEDNLPVIIRIPGPECQKPSIIARFKHEHEICQKLNSRYILKIYSIESFNNTPALIMEDFDGVFLQQLLTKKPALKDFLTIAIHLADALHDIHLGDVIHNNINPGCILINPETNTVKITDFGFASMLSNETGNTKSTPRNMETLHYISPEQTGWMNRSVDYRTDFYSLGVTLYQLLVGSLPFTACDEMGLIHCHLAKLPVPPHQIDPEIPQMVSAILMKLLEKAAEDRYQSAMGLRSDLIRCLAEFEETGGIAPFLLGADDISDQFKIPRKLYGREKQREELLSAYERARTGKKEILMVTGYTGVGKSSLIYEISQPITESRSFFISGKYDQFQHDIPYSGIIRAFKELIRQILTQNEAQIKTWKQNLLKTLGTNTQVIIEVIPEVELIVGKQPPLLELSPEETKNRFNMVFQKFFRVFCTPEHPLVLFLDDLQWADSSSLKLLEVLLSDSDIKYLLLIGAYRDHEIHEAHPLTITLNNLQNEEIIVNFIQLKPLGLADIQQFLAGTFRHKLEDVIELAKLCFIKTAGNPFFLAQFLYSLYRDKLIKFDLALRKWQWDLNGIRRTGVTDNVVELIADRIRRLSVNLQEVLKLAACLSNQFDLKILSVICEKPLTETYEDLREALHEGILSGINGFFSDDETKLDNMRFTFLHDRFQQAAYSLIHEAERKKVHLSIGRLMLSGIDLQQNGEKLLDIVNQFNLGIDLIESVTEKKALAELELLAGRKSKKATAYEAAYQYFKTGIRLIEDDWNTRYDLTLSLYMEAGEAAYLTGDFANAEYFLHTAIGNSKTILDKIKAYEIIVAAYSVQNKLEEAIAMAVVILKLVGINIPKNPSKPDIIVALAKMKWTLLKKRPDDLLNMPLMTDPIAIAVDRLAIRVGVTAYKWNPNFFVLLILMLIDKLYLKFGNSTVHNTLYPCLGLVLCTIGDIDLGYKIGELFLKSSGRLTTNEYKPFALQIFYTYIAFWKIPLSRILPPLLAGYSESMEVGNISIACLGIFCFCSYSFYAGKKLTVLQDEMSLYSNTIGKTKNKELLYPQLIFHQTVLNLMGFNDNPSILNGKIYDQDRMLPLHFKENDLNPITYCYACSLILSYLFGDYDKAVENGESAIKYIDGLIATIGVQYIYFYVTLALLAKYDYLPLIKQYQVLKTVVAYQRKVRKWAYQAPVNFLHMYYMIEAEKARVLKKDLRAMAYYDKAIKQSAENEYFREEALANELAAKFHLSLGNDRLARFYLLNAYSGYYVWGATAKVRQLEKQYTHLLKEQSIRNSNLDIFDAVNIPASSPEIDFPEKLDLVTVKKASQAISGEIVLENLLKRLVEIVLEDAGAQSVRLILKRDGQLYIEASGKMDQNRKIDLMQMIPVSGCDDLPESIVNYVARTKESIVLDDATEAKQFMDDQYIKRNRPKSVLCMPIISQGELKGLLYLENNLINGVFTENRINILNILSSQLAISLENAIFYSRLDELVNKRAVELTETLNDLKKAEHHLPEPAKTPSFKQLVSGVAHEINTPHLENLFSLQKTISMLKSNLIFPAELDQDNRLLSKREAEIAELLCQRMTMAEIAAKLLISRRTVETHVENIKVKLQVRSKKELVAKILKSN